MTTKTTTDRRERFTAKFPLVARTLAVDDILSFMDEEIARAVGEERERVKEQVDELWTSMEERKAKTKAGSPARQFCRGATIAYKEILALLSPSPNQN